MALNGECPWCPEVNESAIDDEALRSLIGEQEYAAIREAERRT
jgi:phage FluMu protein Com